ncbi:mitochondrial carrier [Gigaspora margarita]|uniref:Mitochondrial carrier n=1 Tax=Gigaspora margarita TaxID=4874 RepID=A0A8H3XDD8_GIGMA|nr:mitochondrial carrier [Gigaspora margarita]
MSSTNINIIDSSIAAIVARLFTHPLDTIRVLAQTTLSTPSYSYPSLISNTKSSPDRVKHIYYFFKSTIQKNPVIQVIRQTPIKNLYNGLPIATILGIPSTSSFLFVYDTFKYRLSSNFNIKDDRMLNHILSGTFAEIISGMFWTPMEVIKSKLQASGTNFQFREIKNECLNKEFVSQKNFTDKRITSSYIGRNGNINTFEISNHIFKEEGLRGFYRGYFITLAVFIPHSVTYFVIYEKCKIWGRAKYLKKNELSNSIDLPFSSYLLYSGFSCAIAASVSNVLDIVKTRTQVSSHESITIDDTGKLHSIKNLPREIIKNMYKYEGGLRAFAKGMSSRILWAVPSSSISMAVFEVLKDRRNKINLEKV